MASMPRVQKRDRIEVVKEELINKILEEQLKAGEQFPSEKMLMEEYNITRGYARQIIHELELEGYIECSQGKRAIVCSPDNYKPQINITDRTTFAIAMQDQQTKHTQKIFQGFMEVTSEHKIQTVSYNLYFDENTEEKFLRNVRRMGVKGLAFWAHSNKDVIKDIIQRMVKSHFPIVLIDRYLPEISADAVVSDNVCIGEKLTECLIKNGHKRIAFVGGELHSSSSNERFQGYKQMLLRHNLEFVEDYLVIAESHCLPPAIDRVLALKVKPTAFVFSYDKLAYTAYREIVRLGYKVPEEIEIATLSDEEYAQNYLFPAWVFFQNSVEIGRVACEKLIERFNNPEKRAEIVKISPVPKEPYYFSPS